MGKAFNILDKRITQRLVKAYGGTLQTITTSGSETLGAMVQRAEPQMKRFKPVTTLRIFAHGLYSTVGGQTTTQTTGNVSGGFGVQLAKEGLSATTVSQLKPLAKYLDQNAKVIVYACGAAAVAQPSKSCSASGPGLGASVLSQGNGAFLMDKLAKTLGVPVYASDEVQIFNNKTYTPQFFGSPTTFADFGAWEGNVYKFDGAGNKADVTASAPTH